MTLKRIHINQHVIKANAKSGDRNPVITVKTSKSNEYAHAVHIMGGSTVVYSPDKPLSCGAKVWIETSDVVECWGRVEGEVLSNDEDYINRRVLA